MAANNTQRGGIATFTIKLGALERRVIGVMGTFLRVKDTVRDLVISTRSNKVGPGDGREFTNTMKKFEKIFTDSEFDEVCVSTADGEAANIELQIGYGDYEAEILSRTLAAAVVNTDITGASENITSTGVVTPNQGQRAIGQIFPTNLQRKSARFRARSLNVSCNVAPGNPVFAAIGLWSESALVDVAGQLVELYGVAWPLTPYVDISSGFSATYGPGEADLVPFDTTAPLYIGLVFLEDYRAEVFNIDAEMAVDYIEEVYTAS